MPSDKASSSSGESNKIINFEILETDPSHRIRVVDLQLQELNAKFNEENIELLQCVACLSPASSFVAFDVDKLLRMVELYLNDVSEVVMRRQLQSYVRNVRGDPDFAKLNGLSELCEKLVKTNKSTTFDLVYKFMKLALILPVATASVERVFSAMKYVKSQLSNKIGDQWLNDRLVTYIERDVLKNI